MTIATLRSQTRAEGIVSVLNDRLQHAKAATKLYRKRRVVYRRTLAELCSLSDRELADVGIARCSVRRIARDTAEREQANG
tara:strand:- start:217 stop:459 length:243 start_codon:yes stop_codon:yes gene_type:complete